MQYNLPFCGSGFPNYRQFHPCNFSFQHQYPEVIGEGDVASVIFPDGSIHFYFIPTNRRNDSYCQHEIPTHNPYCYKGTGAFYVKSISNPMSAAVFNQQYQKNYRTPLSGPCLYSDCNVNNPNPFQLKFHNDSWTSTTDLRYFYPRLRRCEWPPISSPMECAAVQTDVPAEAPNVCQIACAKPCLCLRDSNVNEISSHIDTVDERSCDKLNKNRSRSSISSGRRTSKTKLRKKKSRLSLKKHHKARKLLNKESHVQCKCREPRTTDKSVTTYADQASSCTAAERDTQTSCIQELKRIMSQSSKKTELWFPSSSKSKPAEIKSSEKIIGVFETDGSSASCCCSETDTDGTITNN